jgi:hypothetical protein
VGVRKVEIEIEELSLDGFAPADRFRIADSIKRELARLIGEQGPKDLASQRSLRRLNGGSFQVAPGASAEGVGGQVAHAVHGGLVRKAGRR